MFLYFLQGLTFGFAAAVQPGPFQTYLISQTISRGWRRTLPAVLAPLLSDGPILALVLLVLSRVPENVVQILRLAGGAFVIYLAVGAFKTWRSFSGQPAAARSGPNSLFQAAFVNLLSPNPYLFWSLVGGPILLAGWRINPFNSVVMLLGFYLVMIGSTAVGVVLLGTTGRLGPKVNRLLLGISALALFCLGIYQIWLGLLGLLK
ncbi:MAG TPA: LysE family transporter [Anaerolineales bacterium]|nr:LysE family transporter [Anaerolineales bacterium]